MLFHLTILGASSALPTLGSFTTSQYLKIQNHQFLIDCGEGTQKQMQHFSIASLQIDAIFISHLHGDHYLGLPGLLFSMNLQKRHKPLHLFGPAGLDEIITLQRKHARSDFLFDIYFQMVNTNTPELIFETDTLTVDSIPLQHKIPCCGYVFKEKPKPNRIDKTKLHESIIPYITSLKKGIDIVDPSGDVLYKASDFTIPPNPSYSYGYCSDTMYSQNICKLLQDVDILYHEATFAEEDSKRALQTKHSTAKQAALIARQANVKMLLIGHFSARYKHPEILLNEARVIFPKTYIAEEGHIYTPTNNE